MMCQGKINKKLPTTRQVPTEGHRECVTITGSLYKKQLYIIRPPAWFVISPFQMSCWVLFMNGQSGWRFV